MKMANELSPFDDTNINPEYYVAWLNYFIPIKESINSSERFLIWLGQYITIKSDTISNTFSDFFKCNTTPPVSLVEYIQRLNDFHEPKLNTRSILPFIYSAGFLKRYFEMTHQHLSKNEAKNIHRLFAIAFLIGMKLTYDRCYDGAYYAQTLGLEKEILISLEAAFLNSICFNIAFSYEETDLLYKNYKNFCLCRAVENITKDTACKIKLCQPLDRP